MTRTLRFIATRAALTLLVVVGAITLLTSLTALVPGNVADVLLGPNATPATVAALTQRMGLDQPLPVQVWRFFAGVARGDLGSDVICGRPVLQMVAEVLPFTLALTATSMGVSILLGVPLGCFAAAHANRWPDRLTALLSVGFIAMPSFVMALYLLLIFSIWLNLLPVLGAGEPGHPGDQLIHLILPTAALALGWIGYIARLVRASLIEVLNEAYIRTSRAYGLSERAILYKYALKNAAIPTVAVIGLGVGRLLGGAIFAEIIFGRPGIGSLIRDGIAARNYPVVQGAVLVVVLLFVATNLAVDLLYGWLDPRLHADRAVGLRPGPAAP